MINKLKEILIPKCLSALVPSKKAFSLAEVLITLGIIGVVAAITIPALIKDYNKKSWNTSATVFEKKLEDALKTMNSQSTLTGHTTTESFVNELSKHFKTNKICQNEELLNCFSKTVFWGIGETQPEEIDMDIIKTSANFGQNDWSTNVIGVQFANGTNALLAYNPTDTCLQDPYSNQINGNDCLAILYDTSGEKKPNTSGKDLRANGNVRKLGVSCTFEIGSTCFTSTPFYPAAHTWNSCENGTTTNSEDLAFMEKYGIKYCSSSSDRWAGAVKACNGVDKLPTIAQLNQLGEYLYKTNNNMSYQDKALALGFTLTSGQYFYVWSNKEYTHEYTNRMAYLPNASSLNYNLRSSTAMQVICVE